MGKQKPVEIITPPNVLKAKLGGPLNLNSEEVIARAERALQNLSHGFDDWLDEELCRVEVAWEKAKDLTDRDTQLSELHGRAHDLKGLAATYGYPLITRYAASLCRLLRTKDSRENAPRELLEAHVRACRTAMRQGIKEADHPVGVALAQELESQTEPFVEAD